MADCKNTLFESAKILKLGFAQTDMLRIMLKKQKQLPEEQTFYINESESQCRRINKNMVWIDWYTCFAATSAAAA